MERREIVATVAVLIPLVSGAVWIGKLSNAVTTLEGQGVPGAVAKAIEDVQHARDEAVQKLAENWVPGAILASYSKEFKPPPGWEVCGGPNSPPLNDRYLIGTTDLSLVGDPEVVGQAEHSHGFDEYSTGEKNNEHRSGAPESDQDYADNIHKGVSGTGPRNWYHEHQVKGSTDPASSLPPSVPVIFYCRTAP